LQAVNLITEDIDANVALHVCVPPPWGSQYDFLSSSFPEEHIDELAPEFARKGLDDPDLLRRYRAASEVGVGVIDVTAR
jgi:methionine synthase II (cobalamin-independent)